MKKLIGHLLSLIVGGFFVWAGIVKLTGPTEFFQSILHYQLVGEDAAWWTAMFLPWLEVFAGIGLIIPQTRSGALAWLTLLLLVFEASLVSALARGLNIDCGCLGGSGSSVTFALARNGFLLAALVGIYFISICPRKKIL
ncbi:MauE/DoxX family redox-associated membrane protein [Cerasicoccus arenae]|uniref:Methylamine utilisation protein MauE domain-containing protein n=1 Tax=Cerasicoccus arenae TaxID=424488 RepID=A0A8J3D9W5_9BACT|nr:MauE/DoxX family redox-associated membrane protein [Cerasicoccus arenae]MBK1859672.1 hypothetical protein [Cerasicoccus arenae]GHB92960.1 hypothetical protein GCM10007047_05410 [Cerasicoccus arenae]